MDDQEFAKIIELITQRTGIIPLESHKTGIKNYINKRLGENVPKLGGKAVVSTETDKAEATAKTLTYAGFYTQLLGNREEMINLINSATVNETYFFREEAQFALLQSKIFPELVAKNPTKRLRLWSAASSSGEEIYSLLLLANAMGIKTECIASDINTKVLETCKSGVYKKNAVRTVDGAAFHHLLAPYKQSNGGFVLPKKLCDQVTRLQINLSKLENFPKNQDIILIRNVFIYFSNEMKKQILSYIVQESLAPGGYLFLSMNEVASIETAMLPESIEKIVDGKVFYFRKKIQASIATNTSKAGV